MRTFAPCTVLVALSLTGLPAAGRAAPLRTDPGVEQVSGPTVPELSDREKEARRILRLASGQAIRVVSRWRDGAWEYKGKSGWERLDPRIVAGVETERDILRLWRERRAKADLKDHEARVELARWAADEGLATEALAELDAVLAADPDHPRALAVLESRWLLSVPSMEVPADAERTAREALLRFGSGLPPAAREVAVRELARARDREALRADLARDLWSPIVVRRSFAALALRRLFAGEEVKPLLVHAVLDASEDVRVGSALALKAANEPALVLPAIRALASPSVYVRANAATALGHMGYPAAVEPLISRLAAAMQAGSDARAPHAHIFSGRQVAYVQDFDVEVAQFQAVADPQVNVLLEGNALEAAVIGAREESVAIEVVAIRQALENLVQCRPGGTARDWLRWWERESGKWRAADHAGPATAGG